MKLLNPTLMLTQVSLFLSIFYPGMAFSEVPAGRKSQAMVYDPETKKYFVGSDAQFMLRQGENSSLIDKIEVSVDGGEYQAYLGSIKFNQEGKHSIKFRALNPVNMWSPVQFTEVFVDLTPPLTQANFAEGRFWQSNPMMFAALNSTITLSAQDNLSGLTTTEFSWNGSEFIPYTKPILIEKPGAQKLYFRSVDKVGNSEPVKTLDFTADGRAPASEMKVTGGVLRPATIQGKTYMAGNDNVALSLQAQDDPSGIREIYVSIDGKSFAPYLKPIYFLQEGPHTLSFYAEDSVGNKEEQKSIALYTVSTPPRTAAIPIGKIVNTGGINFAKSDLELKLEAKDNLIGLERIEFKLDGAAGFTTYVNPIRFENQGSYTVTFRSVDRAGNVEPSRTFSVQVTNEAPETTLQTAQPLVVRDGVSYSPSPNIVTMNVKNSGVGVAQTLVSINNSAFKPYDGPMTLTADQRTYRLSFKSVDKLGNEEIAKTVTYQMIGNTPVVDLFISGDRAKEEQVRTNYFEGAPQSPVQNSAPVSARGLASERPNSRKK